MITLGIDPGTLFTGYGLVEKSGNAFRAVDYGVIATNAKDEMPKRLKQIYDALACVIEKYRPAKVSLETAFFGKNVQSALKLGQVRGVVMVLAMNYQLPISEHAPREVKKAVTGNGNAAKEQVEFMVKNLLSIQGAKARSDAFDALAIALSDALVSTSVPNQSSLSPTKVTTWQAFIQTHPHRIISP
ncbi:MAG: crossover junction endodeoxyribonuclease RuvC [Chloroherpetonaceae bacterium]